MLYLASRRRPLFGAMQPLIAIALPAIALLAACSGGSSNDPDGLSGGPSETRVRSIALTGSDGVTSTGGSTPVPVISPYIGDGEFMMDWDVSSSSPYRMEWHLSTDAVLSDDDPLFFARNCDLDVPGSSCRQAAATYGCVFNSSSTFVCDGGTLIGDTTNVSAYLSSTLGLPATYRVIAQACNNLLTSCVETVFIASLQ